MLDVDAGEYRGVAVVLDIKVSVYAVTPVEIPYSRSSGEADSVVSFIF
ncbi:MAG: hypothetical protein ACLR5G_01665 [Eubacteriales bacterium]